MSVEEARSYNPSSGLIKDAFQIATSKYSDYLSDPEEVLEKNPKFAAEIVSDMFTAGVAFLANYALDTRIEAVGTILWNEVHQGNLNVAFVYDVEYYARKIGFTEDEASSDMLSQNLLTALIRLNSKSDRNDIYIIIPPQFIFDALENPIIALTGILSIASNVNDSLCGRIGIYPENVIAREEAFKAQLLNQAYEEDPDLELGEHAYYLMKKYPNGLEDETTWRIFGQDEFGGDISSRGFIFPGLM